MRASGYERLRYYLPEDFASRLLIGTIVFLGTAVLIGSLLAPMLFPGQFTSEGRDGLNLVAYLTAW